MKAPAVSYVRTSDGYDIAHAVIGGGRPLVLMPEPVSHIEIYWTEETFVRPWLQQLGSRFRLVQYDGRGQGMSSRGLQPGHSLAGEVRDLDAVVHRLKLNRFVLAGRSHATILYAVAHPERLDALVVFAMPPSGSSWPASYLIDMARNDWDMFVRSQTAFANPRDALASERRIKASITQADWLVRTQAALASDISALLPRLKVPALVLKSRDLASPSLEESASLAGLIPDSRLAVIDGVTPMGNADQGLEAIDHFLLEIGEGTSQMATEADHLSPREIEVLRLLATGRSNGEVAAELVISPNTVAKHVTSILSKTGAENRVEAAMYAHRHGLV